MNQELLKTLIELVLTVMALVLSSVVIPYIKNRLGNDKYDKLLVYIEYAVRSAEQLYKINESKEKKRYVYNYILQKSDDLGLDLNPDDIDLLVEGVVNFVKYGDTE